MYQGFLRCFILILSHINSLKSEIHSLVKLFQMRLRYIIEYYIYCYFTNFTFDTKTGIPGMPEPQNRVTQSTITYYNPTITLLASSQKIHIPRALSPISVVPQTPGKPRVPQPQKPRNPGLYNRLAQPNKTQLSAAP